MKKWRAKKAVKGGNYWTLWFSDYHNKYFPFQNEEQGSAYDKEKWKLGIYYKTKKEAQVECNKRNALIKKLKGNKDTVFNWRLLYK